MAPDGLDRILRLALLGLSIARYNDPVPPADRKLRDVAAWDDACDWIAANTPADALFLTPRLASSFKWRTGRPEVVTYKDIPQDARSMVEWNRRLRDIFYIQFAGNFELLKSLGHLPRQRMQQIVDEYEIDYILTEGDVRLDYPIVYPAPESPNKEYVVYQVEPRGPRSRN